MSRLRFLILVIVLAIVVGADFYAAHLAADQRLRQAGLRTTIPTTERLLAGLRARQEATARDLRLAAQQLAQLVPAATPPSDPARDAELQVWVGRVKQLRQFSSTHPDSRIPEMQLLTDADWLRIAREASFETNDRARESLASLRTAAKTKFALQLAAALTKYQQAGHDQLPTSPLELSPYFDPAVDSAILQRYAMTKSGAFADNRRGEAIREIAAVDAAYDFRFGVSVTGAYGFDDSPTAWIDDFPARMRRAAETYAALHPGAQATGLKEVAPYLDPPLPPALLDRMLKLPTLGRIVP